MSDSFCRRRKTTDVQLGSKTNLGQLQTDFGFSTIHAAEVEETKSPAKFLPTPLRRVERFFLQGKGKRPQRISR